MCQPPPIKIIFQQIHLFWYQLIPFLCILFLNGVDSLESLNKTVTHTDAAEFLLEVKKLISNGNRDFIKRTYNRDGVKVRWIEALFEIGLTEINQVWNEILLLTSSDYYQGPIPDRDRPLDGDVIWIFKKDINDHLVYIKLRIDQRGCVCLSFHKDW